MGYRYLFYDENGVVLEVPEGSEVNESTPVNDFSSEVFEDVKAIREMLEEDREKREQEQEEQATTEEVTTEEILEEPNLDITFDRPVDSNLYLSGKAAGYITDGDLYSMLLSIRNILLLFFLMWAICKLLAMFKSGLYRLMNK